MRWQATVIKAGSLVAALLMSCEPGEGFCPVGPIVCEGEGCADAGAPTTEQCITFEQAAELAKFAGRRIRKLTVTAEPPMFGFVSATATDSRAICRDNTCYLFPDGEALLHAVPTTQVLFVGWSGCSTSTDSNLTLPATASNLQCVAHFAPAFIILSASSTGGSGAPIHVTSSTGCDSDNSCVVFYGGSFTVTAPTDPGFQFTGWTGCANSTDPVLVLTNVTGPLPACVAQYQPVP